jgi:hypothetical protein
MKTGKGPDATFTKPVFNCEGDVFKQAAMQSMRTHIKDGHLKAGHEKEFKPAKHINDKKYVMSYEYKELGNPKRDPKSYRDDEGSVKTAPTNFYTNPMKKGRSGTM